MTDARPPRSLGAVEADVPVVPWPEHDETRRLLVSLHIPRILVVAPGEQPPSSPDQLEDWVFEPADPADVAARAGVLRERARTAARDVPHLDEDGLLRRGDRWVAIPPQQTSIVALLVDHFDHLVRTEVIAEAYARAGGSTNPQSLRTLVTRLAKRVRPLDLELHTLRRRGVLLSLARPADGASEAP